MLAIEILHKGINVEVVNDTVVVHVTHERTLGIIDTEGYFIMCSASCLSWRKDQGKAQSRKKSGHK
jgi:predicted HD phosphohydrolase